MSDPQPPLYDFGAFRLDPGRWVLEHEGKAVPLTPRLFDTLLVLVENHGRVVTKEELFQKVWKGVLVDENNLAQTVSVLRKTLGNGVNGDRYIRTVTRRGYSFVAPVTRSFVAPAVGHSGVDFSVLEAIPPRPPPEIQPTQETRAASRSRRLPTWAAGMVLAGAILLGLGILWWARDVAHDDSTALPGVRSIAVLPFRPLAPTEGNPYLGLALADAVITRLGYVGRLCVRPTSAVQDLRDLDPVTAGRQLAVDAILEGSIQESGNDVRVTVQLVDVRQGTPIWSDKFDVPRSGLFSLEDSVSESVAYALAAKLSPGESGKLARRRPSSKAEAYEAYRRGRYLWNRRSNLDFRGAVGEFEAALAVDPHFAPAWSGIADARVLLGPDAPEQFPLARAAAEKALSLDPDLAEAHASLAMSRLFGGWDFAGAGREFRRALDLAPGYATAHHWYAYWLAAMGRFDEAVLEIKRAREIDPTSPAVNRDVGHILLYARRYGEAAGELRSFLRKDPSSLQARAYLVGALIYDSRLQEAASELAPLSAPHRRQFEALLEARAGRPGAMRGCISDLIAGVESGSARPDAVAMAYGWLGDKDEAFRWLERDFREHHFYLVFLAIDPAFDPLRADPRFADLTRRVGLPSL